jgi:hypothetical protein
MRYAVSFMAFGGKQPSVFVVLGIALRSFTLDITPERDHLSENDWIFRLSPARHEVVTPPSVGKLAQV